MGKKNNIILIGFMGAGKTSIGKMLAGTSDLRFLDTDEYIVEKEGRSINEIFAKEGEGYFRDLETRTLKELLEKDGGCVISVGGGLPVRQENRALLKQLGTVVFLEAEVDTLVGRLEGSSERPMLQGFDLRERITELMDRRMDAYREAADLSVLTDDLSREETAAAVLTLVKGETV